LALEKSQIEEYPRRQAKKKNAMNCRRIIKTGYEEVQCG
jgi:hypothetical protein